MNLMFCSAVSYGERRGSCLSPSYVSTGWGGLSRRPQPTALTSAAPTLLSSSRKISRKWLFTPLGAWLSGCRISVVSSSSSCSIRLRKARGRYGKQPQHVLSYRGALTGTPSQASAPPAQEATWSSGCVPAQRMHDASSVSTVGTSTRGKTASRLQRAGCVHSHTGLPSCGLAHKWKEKGLCDKRLHYRVLRLPVLAGNGPGGHTRAEQRQRKETGKSCFPRPTARSAWPRAGRVCPPPSVLVSVVSEARGSEVRELWRPVFAGLRAWGAD